MATDAVRTRPFGDAGPAVTLRMFAMCLPFSVLAMEATFALSAGVSRPLLRCECVRRSRAGG